MSRKSTHSPDTVTSIAKSWRHATLGGPAVYPLEHCDIPGCLGLPFVAIKAHSLYRIVCFRHFEDVKAEAATLPPPELVGVS